MSKISVLTPTRWRTRRMEEFAISMNESVSDQKNVELLFYVDDDDRESIEKLSELNGRFNNVSGVVGPTGILSDLFNRLLPYCSKETEIYFPEGDDSLFRTKDWDLQVLNFFDTTFKDKIVWYYVNDGHHGERFGTSGIAHKNWVEALGYLVPPYFIADYGDTWIWEISKAIGRNIYSGIYMEHMHPVFGKGEWDRTHQLRIQRYKENIPELFDSAEMIKKRQEDISKLSNYIENYK